MVMAYKKHRTTFCMLMEYMCYSIREQQDAIVESAYHRISSFVLFFCCVTELLRLSISL